MANPGTDISCNVSGSTWDLDPAFTLISGERVLLESCARAVQTRRGLMADEPARGFDVEDLENARTYPGSARAIQAAIDAELRQDERIDSVTVSVSMNGDLWEIVMDGRASTGTPFRFVFQIKDGGGVEIIKGAADG